MSAERLWRPTLIAFALAAIAYLCAELALAGRLGPSLDDGWIYMAFARSMASGEGITYPGHDGCVAAGTGPAWCTLLALSFVVFGASVAVAKLCGVLAGLFALWAVRRLGHSATGDLRTANVAALLLALSPRFLWGTLSVMEVAVYVRAVAWGLALHLDRRALPLARWLPAALVLTLAGWARPECFVFLPLAALHRRRLPDLAVTLGLLCTFPIYHLVAHGHPLPTTFYVKAAGSTPMAVLHEQGVGAALAALVSGVTTEVAAFAAYLPTWMPLLVPALLLGLRRGVRERNGIPFLAACLLLFIVARGALGFSPPWFQHGRYFQHTFVLFALVCLHGLSFERTAPLWSLGVFAVFGAALWLGARLTILLVWDYRWGEVEMPLDELAMWLVWIPAGIATAFAVGGYAAHRGEPMGRPPLWAFACWMVPALALGVLRHGQGVRDTYALNVAMAEKVREIVPEGETVACHDIGALGYFAGRPLLDLAGLGSPEVAFRPSDAPRDIATLLAERRVRWLCLTEQMADMVNPSADDIPGLVSMRPRASIVHAENVTVAGTTYHLLELVWE